MGTTDLLLCSATTKVDAHLPETRHRRELPYISVTEIEIENSTQEKQQSLIQNLSLHSLHPMISKHIPHTVPCKFPKGLTRGMCQTI